MAPVYSCYLLHLSGRLSDKTWLYAAASLSIPTCYKCRWALWCSAWRRGRGGLRKWWPEYFHSRWYLCSLTITSEGKGQRLKSPLPHLCAPDRQHSTFPLLNSPVISQQLLQDGSFFCCSLISLHIVSLVFLPLSSPWQWNTVTPISGFPRRPNTAVWLSHFPTIKHLACQHFHLVPPTVTLSPFHLVAFFQPPPPPAFTLPTSVTHCTRGWQHQR